MSRPPPAPTLSPYTTLFRSPAPCLRRRSRSSRITMNVGMGSREAPARVSPRSKLSYTPALSDTLRLTHCTGFVPERSEEHTSELQSPMYLVCRLLLEKKNDA